MVLASMLVVQVALLGEREWMSLAAEEAGLALGALGGLREQMARVGGEEC